MSTDSTFESEESFARESEKSPETLEREIDAQRSSIGNIVDALESKFSPGQLIDQALAYTKGNGGEFFANLGTTIKANPVPTVLTSVGLLWLIMGQNRTATPSSGPSTLDHLGERISGMAQTVTDSFGSAKARIEETAQRMKEKAGHVSETASHLTDSVSDKLSATGQRANMSTHDLGDTLQQQARKAQSSLDRMLREQPLALAAIGIALGAALGAALPSTERENRMMGQASDQLTDKAKQLASEGYDKVAQMGKDVADTSTTTGIASGPSEGHRTPGPAAPPADLSSGLG
jgi:ElaB/YqjD/DUF883 family membrane-anchored ribosome-binding protein